MHLLIFPRASLGTQKTKKQKKQKKIKKQKNELF